MFTRACRNDLQPALNGSRGISSTSPIVKCLEVPTPNMRWGCGIADDDEVLPHVLRRNIAPSFNLIEDLQGRGGPAGCWWAPRRIEEIGQACRNAASERGGSSTTSPIPTRLRGALYSGRRGPANQGESVRPSSMPAPYHVAGGVYHLPSRPVPVRLLSPPTRARPRQPNIQLGRLRRHAGSSRTQGTFTNENGPRDLAWSPNIKTQVPSRLQAEGAGRWRL